MNENLRIEGRKQVDQTDKDRIKSLLFRKPSLEGEIAALLSLPRQEAVCILQSDRHVFRRTGFMRLGTNPDYQWELTKVYKREVKRGFREDMKRSLQEEKSERKRVRNATAN